MATAEDDAQDPFVEFLVERHLHNLSEVEKKRNTNNTS